MFLCWAQRDMCMFMFQTVQTSVSVLCGTEQLIGSLPEVKWAKQVVCLATELQEHCLHSIVTHLPRIIHTTAFHSLRRVGTHMYTQPQRPLHNHNIYRKVPHTTASFCELIWLCFSCSLNFKYSHTPFQSYRSKFMMYINVLVTVT